MTSSDSGPGDERPRTVLMVWAIVLIPVVLVLPMYVFPVVLVRPISGYTGRRLLEIAWAAGLVMALFRAQHGSAAAASWAALPSRIRVAVIALTAGALASAVLSAAPLYAIRAWALMTLLGVALLSLTTLPAAARTRVLEWLGLTVLLYGILVIPDPEMHGFANPRFQGQVLAVAAPALLYTGQPVLALMAAPAIALGVINGSRAFILTLVVTTAVAAFLWPDRRRRVLSGLLGLATAGAIVGILLWVGQGDALESAVQKGGSSSGRWEMWWQTVQAFLDAPVLGHGPGMMALAPGLGRSGLAHPHNTVLLIAAELGLVGLLSTGVMAVEGLRRLTWVTPERRPWVMAVVGGGFHSLLSGTILMPASQALLVLAVALSLPALRGTAHSTPSGNRRRTGIVLAALGMGSLILVLATLGLSPVTGSAPRFFRAGLIP